MSNLNDFKCIPCSKGAPALSDAEITELQPQAPGWQVITRVGVPQLERICLFKNFAEALAFTNKVGELAEIEQHHPAILTEWGKVTVTWWTHAIHGLHRNDFIMAAKTNALLNSGDEK
jgi:4a-hydroxytetrahydrobiopterin dehydratase